MLKRPTRARAPIFAEQFAVFGTAGDDHAVVRIVDPHDSIGIDGDAARTSQAGYLKLTDHLAVAKAHQRDEVVLSLVQYPETLRSRLEAIGGRTR